MKGATLFSGIDAPEVSAPAIDWLWRAEIDKFPNAVSKFHRPDTPNLGDVSADDFVERALEHGRPDLVVFGSPCQSFSVAGKRLGLDDARGNLALVALDVVRRIQPTWFVFENVPGLFSSDEGRDFDAFLTTVEECGYQGCWRVLDAQYSGVPQRRRRIFFVGYLGDWRPAAAVLFERESLRWNPAPCREEGEGIAPTISARTKGGGGLGTDFDCDGGLIARCVTAREGMRQDYETETLITHSLRAEGFDASEDGTGRGTPLVPVAFKENMSVPSWGIDKSETLQAENFAAVMTLAVRGRDGGHDLETRDDGIANAILTPNGGRGGMGVGAVAIAENQRGELRTSDVSPQLTVGGGKPGQGYPAVAFTASEQSNSYAWERDVYPTLNAQIPNDSSNLQQGVRHGMAVRRLTPVECSRLQGFPDNYTRIPWRGKPAEQCPDGPRYRAMGNSMAVPVIGWILDRIQKFEALA